MPIASKDPVNLEQYVGFKVMVYRLDFGNRLLCPKKTQGWTVNDFLYADFSTARYQQLVDFVNDNFADVIEGINEAIFIELYDGLNKPATNCGEYRPIFTNDAVFQQYDITPLISSFSTSISLDDQNTCVLSMLDPGQACFGEQQLQSSYENTAQSFRGGSPTAHSFSTKYKDFLRSFSFREFDFVRVSVYSRTDAPMSVRMGNLSDSGIPTDFVYVPNFTGLVTGISKSTGVGQIPVFNVSCVGMSRVLSQTLTVFSQAIGQLLSNGAGNGKPSDASIKILKRDFNVTSNIFSGKNSEQVFTTLMSDTFYPSYAMSDDGRHPSVGAPCLDPSYWIHKILVPGNVQSAVQFLPMLLMYHILKYMMSEPIVVFDERLGKRGDSAGKSIEGVGHSTTIIVKPPVASGFLEPYLISARDSYQMFDSSYMSPLDIISEIRSKTFYEVFEDRSGAFHFRFPRYNDKSIRHQTNPIFVKSVSMRKDDSTAYNTVVAQPMMAWQNRIPGVAGNYYIDRLSFYRYGLRMPQIVENPNAVSFGFAKKLAEFLRGYNAGKTGRTATIDQLIDSSIMVGDTIVFQTVCPFQSQSQLAAVDSGASDETTMVGYVVGIHETMGVSGECSQTLELGFVRTATLYHDKDAPGLPLEVTSSRKTGPRAVVSQPTANSSLTAPSAPKPEKSPCIRVLSASEASSYLNFSSSAVKNDTHMGYIPLAIRAMSQKMTTNQLIITDGEAKQSDFSILVDAGYTDANYANFKYMADPLTLAADIAIFKDEIHNAYALAAGKPYPQTAAEFKTAIAAQGHSVDKIADKMALLSFQGECLGEALKKLRPLISDSGDFVQIIDNRLYYNTDALDDTYRNATLLNDVISAIDEYLSEATEAEAAKMKIMDNSQVFNIQTSGSTNTIVGHVGGQKSLMTRSAKNVLVLVAPFNSTFGRDEKKFTAQWSLYMTQRTNRALCDIITASKLYQDFLNCIAIFVQQTSKSALSQLSTPVKELNYLNQLDKDYIALSKKKPTLFGSPAAAAAATSNPPNQYDVSSGATTSSVKSSSVTP